jgi:tetratricopeptide (TPR) repeat protein
LPLALEQAGAYISDGQLQLDEYLPLFDRYRQELLSLISPSDIFSARKETVFTTWELSFSSVLSQDAAAAQLMLLFAFMHHESLWEGMFLLAAEMQPSASSTSPLESLSWFWELCRDPFRFKAAIRRILSVSLAKRGPSPGSLYLHPLVHSWSRDRLKPEERCQKQLQAVVVLGQALFSISRVAQITEAWSLKQRILLHADVCIGIAKSNGTSTHFYSLFREPAAVHALLQIIDLYYDFGKLKQAENLLSSILSLALENSPGELILECQLKLADVLVMLGRHEEAVQRYLEVLTSTRKYGDKEETALKAQAGLGRVYWVMMKYPESEYNLKVVTNALKSSTGKFGPLGQQAASNLGLLYWHKGELTEALKILDEVLDEIGPERVDNDISSLEHLYRRAIVVQFMGDYQEAKRTFSRVLTKRQELLGPDNLETCQAANALGRVHCFLGEYELAQKLLDTAWSGQERIGLGMNHPAVLRTLFNYGVLNREKGLYDEAFECLDRAGLWQRNLGERNYSYLCCRIELAIVEMGRGQHEAAVRILRSVRQIQKEDYPQYQPECIQAVIALADALTKTGELSEAESLLAMVIPIVKEAFGEGHPALLHAVTSRSRLRRLQGRAAEAVEDLENTVNALATVYGDAHQSTLTAGALLGQIYWDIGREEKGREKISKAWNVMENVLGNEHPKTREVQGMLANLFARELDRLEL